PQQALSGEAEIREHVDRDADVAPDLLVGDAPGNPPPLLVLVAADAPQRRRGLPGGSRHDFATRGILCGGPRRSSASFGTNSTSGSTPVVASTAAISASRTESSRCDHSGA